MHRLVILEDETLIINGLMEKIPWGDLDCEVCGTATDGVSGIDLIDSCRPDIIISDIEMPGKSGIDIAEYVHEHLPGTVVIFLSAHEDFAYAQQAMKYGVEDYILKPIDKSVVASTVRSALAKLNRQQESHDYHSALEDRVSKTRPLLNNMYVFDIALGGLEESDEVESGFEYFDMDFAAGIMAAVRIETEEPDSLPHLHRYAIRSMIEEVLVNHDHALKVIDDLFVILIKFGETLDANAQKGTIIELCDEITRRIDERFSYPAIAGAGEPWNDISGIHESYRQAVANLDSEGVLEPHADRGKHSHLIEQALNIVRLRYRNPDFGLAEIADDLNTNYSYLSRLFKQETNTSFVKYLTELRVGKARELIETTNLKQCEIAEKVGFRNAGYFSQVLKKEYGTTPTELREGHE